MDYEVMNSKYKLRCARMLAGYTVTYMHRSVISALSPFTSSLLLVQATTDFAYLNCPRILIRKYEYMQVKYFNVYIPKAQMHSIDILATLYCVKSLWQKTMCINNEGKSGGNNKAVNV